MLGEFQQLNITHYNGKPIKSLNEIPNSHRKDFGWIYYKGFTMICTPKFAEENKDKEAKEIFNAI